MIKNKKLVPLDKFIYKSLYDKSKGYYFKKNPFGKEGDFITAPNISKLFSEILSIWTILFWKNLKKPKKINLIELGGGNGEMIFQMVKTLKKFPSFFKSCEIYIYEKSTYLKKIQRKKLINYKIKWINSFNKIENNPNIFIANEFFDALPIKQYFEVNKKWQERYVDITNKNKFRFINKNVNIKLIEKKIGLKISKNQKIIEYSPLLFRYFKLISKKLLRTKGGILIIDYGYLSNIMSDTLQSLYKHKKNDIFENVGKADITHLINFELLKKIAKKYKLKSQGISTQKNFLLNMGIRERAEIISKNLKFSDKANIYFRLRKLIDDKEMGNLFKFMLITSNNIKFKTGFKNWLNQKL